MKLQTKFGIKIAELPPCCLGTVEPATAGSRMVWDPCNDENDKENINKVRLGASCWGPTWGYQLVTHTSKPYATP